jgi:hypothetical protein
MPPTRLGNPGVGFGPLEKEVGGFEGEWLRAIPAGKEPRGRAIDAPLRPQVLQKAGRQERLPVFVTLTLGNA